MKITVNAVEVATELARRATINLLIYNGEYEVESDLVFIEDGTSTIILNLKKCLMIGMILILTY